MPVRAAYVTLIDCLVTVLMNPVEIKFITVVAVLCNQDKAETGVQN